MSECEQRTTAWTRSDSVSPLTVIKRRVGSGVRRVLGAVGPLLLGGFYRGLRLDSIRMGRNVMAQRYFRGDGIEIGAFASPTLMPVGARVKYVDRVPAAHWQEMAEYKGYRLVEPHFIEDGARLDGILDRSCDFLVSSHMLEHVPDPLAALENWLRVVRPGGHIMIVVPDKRYTHDRDRLITTFEHVVRDHEEGPEVSADEHYREIATQVMGIREPTEVEEFVRQREPAVHFHVWDFIAFAEFVFGARAYLGDRFEPVEMKTNVQETLVVLRVN
jgi:predicted SAM-dependent methyltransferase